MTWTHIYVAVWAVATGLAAALTALAIPGGKRFGVMDMPAAEAHKKHREPMSLLGGPAMFLAWLAVVGGGLAVVFLLPETWKETALSPHLAGLESVAGRIGVIAAGAFVLLLVGLVDDIRPMKPLTKLIAQAVVCGAVAAGGIRVTVFVSSPPVTWAITTFWLLFIINAVNFFDNMDGMAAGTALTSSFLFFIIAALQGQYFIAVLAAATGGVALGFLVFNWPPAKLFMGDSGSHVLGYLLGVTAALETFYSPGRNATPASLLIPVLILALPIFDLFAVVWLRVRRGVPFYQGDNMHITHRFRMMGLSRGATTTAVHLLGLTIGAGALPLLWLPLKQAFVVLIQAAAMLTLVSMLHAVNIRKNGEINS